MKQQKEHWVKTLFSFAGPCKGKMTLSVLCAILSVAGGFVPFWAVYEILLLFINRTATLNDILLWCLVGAGGYLIRVICFGISTILAHISAYTILEGIRLKIANRLMRAPLGEVMGRRIGYLKNIIMDQGGGFGAASGPHDPGADIEPAPSGCYFYLGCWRLTGAWVLQS